MGFFKKLVSQRHRPSSASVETIRPTAWAYAPSYTSRSYLVESPADTLERMRQAAEAAGTLTAENERHTTAA